MSDPNGNIQSDSRREFLRGAGVAAGSAALLATGPRVEAQNLTASAQAAANFTPPTEQPGRYVDRATPRRASAPIARVLSQLGPLHELSGAWVGRGFNQVSLPDFDNPTGAQAFRVKVNATHEIIEFTKIGGNVPNRGSTSQRDIDLFGLTYLQRVNDALTNEPLHLEPGIWLRVPPTAVPPQPETVVRMGSIPHGTTILAQGLPHFFRSGPQIHPASTTPRNDKTNAPITGETYLVPFSAATLPPGFPRNFVQDPNLALHRDIVGHNIIETTVLEISTTAIPAKHTLGRIGNIPFLEHNARVAQLDATFWIERVHEADGHEFMQLQYTQTIVFDFLNIFWPHVSVATLLKQ
jgi:hypothetical protein